MDFAIVTVGWSWCDVLLVYPTMTCLFVPTLLDIPYGALMLCPYTTYYSLWFNQSFSPPFVSSFLTLTNAPSILIYPIFSCPVLPYPVLSYPILSCPVQTHRIFELTLTFLWSSSFPPSSMTTGGWYLMIVCGQAAHIWVCRTCTVSIFQHGIFSNKITNFGVVIALLLGCFVTYCPGKIASLIVE